MSAFQINPGTYVLTQTLDNPKPHGRKNGWQHQPTFQAGTKIVVESDPPFAPRLYAQSSNPGDNIPLSDPRFFHILQHCQAVAETPSDYLIRTGQDRRALELVDTLASLLGYDLAKLQGLLDSAPMDPTEETRNALA